MLEKIDWTPVVQSLAATNWTAVFVAVASGLAAVLGPVWLWKKQARRESASVRASLFAEVAALIEVVELRGFLPALREKESILTTRRLSPMQPFQGEQAKEFFEALIDSQYNRVYQGNVSRLGVLEPEEAQQIVRFHQLADAVRRDVIAGGELANGTSNPKDFKEAADMLEIALEIGRALTSSNKRTSPKRLFRKTEK
ncbi:hypothetical protein [Pseudomonas sp. SDO55104_S430]